MNNTSEQFTSFTETILKIVQEKLPEEYEAYSRKIRKNNGIQLTGIVAKRAGSSTSPTIYIDEFFKEGIDWEEMEQIAEAISQDLQRAECNREIDMADFLQFEKARGRIAFKLVNAEKNRELLKLIPHKLFYNLAVVFYYAVQEAPFYGKAAVLIYNSHAKQWNTDTEELYKIALANTPILFPGIIEDMEGVMRAILKEEFVKDLAGRRKDEGEENEIFSEDWMNELVLQMTQGKNEAEKSMYVLTNQQKLQGAACILYPGLLQEFADRMQQNFYVLPSSIHEVILVPGNMDADHTEFKQIVTDINRTQVAEEEILADSVYYYDRSLKKLVWIS